MTTLKYLYFPFSMTEMKRDTPVYMKMHQNALGFFLEVKHAKHKTFIRKSA